MKILNTLALLSIMSMSIEAQSPPVEPLPQKPKMTFEEKQTKIIQKIENKLNSIIKREECFKSTTSLTQMQNCRVEKLKNKPFKLKKGMTFEEKKAKKIAKMDKRIEKLKSKIVCIKNANNKSELKACHPKKRSKNSKTL